MKALLFAIILLISPILVNAISITSFSNDLSEENLTFPSNNYTRYINIPRYANISTAQNNFSGFTSKKTCYQEFANESSECGGLSGGHYLDQVGETANFYYYYYNWTNMFDGDYSTFGEINQSIPAQVTWFFISYKIPSKAVIDNTYWQIKGNNGTDDVLTNISIDKTCWNYSINNNRNLQFMVQSFKDITNLTAWRCKNEDGGLNSYNIILKILGNGSGNKTNRKIYEEAMFWNIVNHTIPIHQNLPDATNNTELVDSRRLTYHNYTKKYNSFAATVNVSMQNPIGGAIISVNFTKVPNICFNQDPIQLRLNNTLAGGNNFLDCWNGTGFETFFNDTPRFLYNKSSITWNATELIDPFLQIGTIDSSTEWNFTYIFNETNSSQQASYVTKLQSILPDCTCTDCTITDEVCQIPYTIGSSGAGYLEYSNLIINYNTNFNISIYNEEDGSLFDIAGHNQTKLISYCENATYETIINQTSTSLNFECLPNFFQLIISKDSSTYFRTLYFFVDSDVKFYMADLNTDSVLEIILNMIDLTSEFSNGYIILEKSINDTVIRIAEQQVTAEDKVTLFLKQNFHYTLKVRDNSGNVRSYGLFYATAAGEKTITLPEINLVTETILGDELNYAWDRTDAAIRLFYNDSGSQTSIIKLNINNISSDTSFFSTTDTDLGYALYTIPVTNKTSWEACFNATHATEGSIINCRIFSLMKAPSITKGKAKLNYWGAVAILIIVCLTATRRYASGSLAAVTILFWIFVRIGWVDFGAWGNGIVIAFGSVFTVLSVFWEGDNV